MDIEQQSEGEQLMKLKIIGDADELRDFALAVLDAVDHGRYEAKIGVTRIKIKCR
jgi:hypothetical protein